jgi:hypothetical protein
MPKTEAKLSPALQRQWLNNGQEKTKRSNDMKKSEKYYLAMCAVIDNHHMSTPDKLEVLEVLMEDRRTALYCEKQEEKTNAESV